MDGGENLSAVPLPNQTRKMSLPDKGVHQRFL